jgi:hypothetical protein
MKFPRCVVLALVLGAPTLALAGPGDPRLVNGVLEWPRALTSEPFLVVRGDDGVIYSVSVSHARRAGPLGAGNRVALLGFEGRATNEIMALGVGAGETSDAALAQLQGRAHVPTPAAPAAATPAPAAATPAPVPAASPSPTTALASPSPAPLTIAATSPASPPKVAEPAAASAGAKGIEASALPALAVPDARPWSEISGVVEAMVGRTLVLRSSEGRVAVDVSSLSPGFDRMVTPGSMVKVYGVPVELRFKAMGFLDEGRARR